MFKTNTIIAAVVTSLITAALLFIVNYVPQNSLLLGARLFKGGGLVQIAIICAYSALLSYKMQNRQERSSWRIRSWLLFSILFYGQLILGIAVDSLFLLSGKLHLPIPAIILAGPIYRINSWFMVILFLSTVLLTGPAWCSHLCYFGAIDGYRARKEKGKKRSKIPTVIYKNRNTIKLGFLLTIVGVALILRICAAGPGVATLIGIFAGVLGLFFIIVFSRRWSTMTNCTLYCPIGTIVNRIKFISPFRFKIGDSCLKCNACIQACSYMALTKEGIAQNKIGPTCTYCGDCISSCAHNSFEYQFLRLSPTAAEKLWIILTVILHSVFLAVARI